MKKRIGMSFLAIVSTVMSCTASFAEDAAPKKNELTRQETSTKTTITTAGVGIKESNKFAFKYKERLKNLKEQINLALTKAWLTPDQGEIFFGKLTRLEILEGGLSAKDYPQPETNELEKAITLLNSDLYTVMNRASSTKQDHAKKNNQENGAPAGK